MVFGKGQPSHAQRVRVPDADRAVLLVARRIAELREARGFTQEQIAVKLGMAAKNYQRIEAGRQNMTIRTLVRIAGVLGVEPIDLWKAPSSAQARAPGRPRTRS